MKFLISIFFLVITQYCFSQVTDISKDKQSFDRVNILSILRNKVRPQMKQNVTFVVRSLQIKDGYAFFKGNVRNANGGPIDFRKTVYKDLVEQEIFDGDATYALFKKVSGQWKYLIHVIGPTDVAYACWAYTYKAPKQLFDYNDNCSN